MNSSASSSPSSRNPRSVPTLLPLILVSASALLTGCGGSRVVFVSAGKDALLRAGPDLKGHVYIPNGKGEWELSANRVTVPEGWYIGPVDDQP